MRRLLSLLALVVALVAWLAWNPDRPARVPGPEPQVGAPSSRSEASPGLGVGASATEVEPAPAVEGGRSAAEAVPAAIGDEDTPLEYGLWITVVRAEDRVPIPGAEVQWIGDGNLALSDIYGLFSGERSVDDLFLSGRSARADERGRVHLEIRQGGVLRGVAPGRSGWLDLGNDVPKTWELALAPQPECFARVVDARGVPRGDVPVDLYERIGRGRSLRFFSRAGDGRVDLAAARDFVRWILRAESVRLALALCDTEVRYSEPLDLDTAKGLVAELTLPELAAVEVQVVGLGSEPRRAWAQVTAQPDAANYVASDRHPSLSEGVLAPLDADGKAHFEWVGLGVPLVVTVWVEGESRPVQRALPGLERAGSKARIEIELPAARPATRLRLLAALDDDSGGAPRPLVDQPIEIGVMLPRSAGVRTSASQRTDADGRLEFRYNRLDRSSSASPEAWSVRLSTRDGRGSRFEASLAMPPDCGERAIDLGDVVLAPLGTVVAGRVVDEAGAPLLGVRIGAASPGDDPSVSLDSAFSGADGRFRIQGTAPPRAPIRLSTNHPDYLAAEVPALVEAGTEDVELVLVRGGSLSIAILLDPELDGSGMELQLTRPDGRPYFARRTEPIDPPAADGAPWVFLLRGLGDETFDVRLVLPGSREVLPLADGVQVPAAQEPSFAPIDLRGRLFGHRLHLVDADGRPLAAAEVELRAAGAEEYPKLSTEARNGDLACLSTSARVDVRAMAEGFGTEEALDVAGAIEIRFVARVAVPIEAPTLQALPEGVRALVAAAAAGKANVLHRTYLDAGVGELQLPTGLRYRIEVYLLDAAHATQKLGGATTQLDLVEGATNGPLRLVVEQAELRRALDALAGESPR